MAAVVSRTQIERGRTALYLSSNLTNKEAYKSLLNDRRITDEKIRLLSWWPRITLEYPIERPMLTLDEFLEYFNDTFRVEAMEGKLTFEHTIHVFTDLNKQLLDVSLSALEVPSDTTAADLLFAFNVLMRATENAGITRAVGSTFFSPCYMTREFRNWIIALEAKIDNCLDFAEQYYPPSRKVYDQFLEDEGMLFPWVQRMREQMTDPEFYPTCAEATMDERFANGNKWFTNITNYVWKLTKTHTYVAEKLVEAVNKVGTGVHVCGCGGLRDMDMGGGYRYLTLNSNKYA